MKKRSKKKKNVLKLEGLRPNLRSNLWPNIDLSLEESLEEKRMKQ
jgi:hypothetical protein